MMKARKSLSSGDRPHHLLSEVTSMSEHLAYLAGFFDGEGSLNHWKASPRKDLVYFRMFVGNTNREILELFLVEFGGSIYEKSKSSPLTKKDLWVWSISGERAWDAYYKMEPWLREKRWKQEPKN